MMYRMPSMTVDQMVPFMKIVGAYNRNLISAIECLIELQDRVVYEQIAGFDFTPHMFLGGDRIRLTPIYHTNQNPEDDRICFHWEMIQTSGR